MFRSLFITALVVVGLALASLTARSQNGPQTSTNTLLATTVGMQFVNFYGVYKTWHYFTPPFTVSVLETATTNPVSSGVQLQRILLPGFALPSGVTEAGLYVFNVSGLATTGNPSYPYQDIVTNTWLINAFLTSQELMPPTLEPLDLTTNITSLDGAGVKSATGYRYEVYNGNGITYIGENRIDLYMTASPTYRVDDAIFILTPTNQWSDLLMSYAGIETYPNIDTYLPNIGYDQLKKALIDKKYSTLLPMVGNVWYMFDLGDLGLSGGMASYNYWTNLVFSSKQNPFGVPPNNAGGLRAYAYPPQYYNTTVSIAADGRTGTISASPKYLAKRGSYGGFMAGQKIPKGSLWFHYVSGGGDFDLSSGGLISVTQPIMPVPTGSLQFQGNRNMVQPGEKAQLIWTVN